MRTLRIRAIFAATLLAASAPSRSRTTRSAAARTSTSPPAPSAAGAASSSATCGAPAPSIRWRRGLSPTSSRPPGNVVPQGPNFRNLLDNSAFNIYQRGTTAVTAINTTATYHADRWAGYANTGAASVDAHQRHVVPSRGLRQRREGAARELQRELAARLSRAGDPQLGSDPAAGAERVRVGVPPRGRELLGGVLRHHGAGHHRHGQRIKASPGFSPRRGRAKRPR
jgi:hypothetical protein